MSSRYIRGKLISFYWRRRILFVRSQFGFGAPAQAVRRHWVPGGRGESQQISILLRQYKYFCCSEGASFIEWKSLMHSGGGATEGKKRRGQEQTRICPVCGEKSSRSRSLAKASVNVLKNCQHFLAFVWVVQVLLLHIKYACYPVS